MRPWSRFCVSLRGMTNPARPENPAMHTATFRAVGGSVSVTLPHQMLRIPGLAASASVAVTVEDGGLVLSPALQPERGHEQQGTRSALVLSPEAFNRFKLGLACPVTRAGASARGHA